VTLNQGFIYREKLGSKADGLTVLQYLSRNYTHSSESDWHSRIDAGRVMVNGTRADSLQVLRPGQTLTWHRPPWVEPEAPTSFAVLFGDPHLLAVAKPRGLPMLPGGGFLLHSLLHIVKARYPDANPLHRLGRGTSGVALFARTTQARTALTQAWQKKDVVRIYRALVTGCPREEALEIHAPIGPVAHPLLGEVHGVHDEGKRSHSKVRLLERRGETSLVQVTLVTGRPHQIRIHLACAGHPLAHDPLYIPGGIPAPETRALPGDLGYHLHAERLGFRHPHSGETVQIDCFPPPPLRLRWEVDSQTSEKD
jgi:23S rRNA pseudouridine1911/1915/1917 synthase